MIRKRLAVALVIVFMPCAPLVSQSGTTVAYYSQVPTVADAAALAATACSSTVNAAQERIQEDTDEKHNCRDPGSGFAWTLVSTASGTGDVVAGSLTAGALVGSDGVDTISSGGDLTHAGLLTITNATEQSRLAFDGSNFASTTVLSDGSIVFNSVGTAPGFSFSGSDLTIDGGAGTGGGLIITPGVARTGLTAEFDTDVLVITDDGQVGIGTASPSAVLDIVTGPDKTIAVGDELGSGNFSGIKLGFRNDAGTFNKAAILYERQGTSAHEGLIHFAMNNVSDSSNVTLSDSVFSISAKGDLAVSGTATTKGCTFHGELSTAPSGVRCHSYFDTDVNKLCVHNSTGFRPTDDYADTTSCT